MRYLNEKKDFDWYKKELDVQSRYDHRHNNDPEKYPCRVRSQWSDDPQGPYTYDHFFTYQQEVACESCGHKKHVWPQAEDELPNASEGQG
jgi:hypothetical protein